MTLAQYVEVIQDPQLVIDMIVGAQQRVCLYPEKGFMIWQEIPESVTVAYERLCAQGFTSRLVASV
jgi:hypothetical protein